MTSLCDLPREIVEEILLRLPPRTLQRCKRVCKLWYAMIKHPKFINKQLDLGIVNNKHPSPVSLFFISDKQGPLARETFFGPDKQVLSVVTIHDKDDGDGDHLPYVFEEVNFPYVPEMERADFPMNFFSSNCNGIIFFYDCQCDRNKVFVLCNPELGEFKLVQTPFLPLFEFMFVGAGFGYDIKANDYKCVKLFGSPFRVEPTRAMVYSLRSDSWREVGIDLNGKCCFVDDGVYHKGFFYWWNMGLEDSETMILSFDFSEEEFHTIELPQHARKLNGKDLKLDIWNESVVFLLSTEILLHSTTFEMWLMVENFGGVEGFTYWTKHLTIGPLAFINCPLAFWKDDELLLQATDGQIVSYNLRTRKSRKLQNLGSTSQWIFQASLYPKSLVSVKRGNILNRRQDSLL